MAQTVTMVMTAFFAVIRFSLVAEVLSYGTAVPSIPILVKVNCTRLGAYSAVRSWITAFGAFSLTDSIPFLQPSFDS